jgi:hypothetical protein
MTAKRFAIIALDSGIAGADENVAGRIVHPEMAAVVISPSGFLMCWDENAIQVSDVGRLANVHQPLANRKDGWDEYYIHNDPEKGATVVGWGFQGSPEPRGWVGNGHTPRPEGLSDFNVQTLADCNRMAISPIDLSENDAYGTYTPQAAEFVRHHLGLDPNTVDWQAANAARIVNAQYATTAPFTPAPARAALRQALTRTAPTQPASGRLTRRTPARTQITRRLPRRPTQ